MRGWTYGWMDGWGGRGGTTCDDDGSRFMTKKAGGVFGSCQADAVGGEFLESNDR